MKTQVEAFFDATTNNLSYVASDPGSGQAVVIDPVLDFDPAAARTTTTSADAIAGYLRDHGLQAKWLLETHVHADHLTAAAYLKTILKAPLGIGFNIPEVQEAFAKLFNFNEDFLRNGSQFDHLFQDNETFMLGNLDARALHVPGHTPVCTAFLIGDALFVGDTLFMPDFGTARCDFPGGSARQLYRSIHRLLALPGETRIFVGHDYGAPGRNEIAWETTVAEQRASNVHLHDGISEEDFVTLRESRDSALPAPHLFLPSVQVNMRAGCLPPPEDNGISYLKLPLDQF